MKQPLRIVCALLSAAAFTAGQTPGPRIPAVSSALPSSTSSEDNALQAGSAAGNAPEAGTPDNKPPAVKAPAGAAAEQKSTALPQEPGEIKPGCDADRPPTPDVAAAKPYVIGTLDVLDIRVWNSPNLSGIFDVQPDGLISVPLIGQVKADGVTVGALTHDIQTRLSNSVFECPPPVNIQVLRVNSKRFFVYGGVNRGGEFPLVNQMTVMDALANCGGFREFANPKKITIQRGDQTLKFNYNEIRKGKNPASNIVLQNGDRIFVPE